MKYLLKLILAFVFGNVGLFAKAPDTAWTRTYGGTSSEDGSSVQQTSDGGYIVAGLTYSFGAGESDFYLIKTNSLGDTLWTKTYGGTDYDRAKSVQQTSDEGYIVAGYAASFGNNDEFYLVKTDSLGDTLWTKTYGGTDYDQANSVQQTSDGGYIVAGFTVSFGAGEVDFYLIKTDSLGDTLWTETYGGAGYDVGYSVQQTSDGGYIVAGYTSSFGAGEVDVYLVKTDSLGDTLWTKTYGGIENDIGNSVQQTSDRGYIVAGYTTSFGAGELDFYLVKTDSLGDTLWTKTYGGTDWDYGNSVQQTSDGGYVFVGYTSSFSAESDYNVYLIKTDSLGDTLWTKTYGGINNDMGNSVQQTSDGGYIVAGQTYGAVGLDVCLIKIKPEESGIEEEINTGLFSLFPADPSLFTTKTTVNYVLTRATNISISVYNMLGQRVRDLYSGKQSSGVHSVSWNGTGDTGEKLSSGIYFLNVEAEGRKASSKVMFVR